LMPAIRAIYFSTRAHEKKRASILENPLKLNCLGASRQLSTGRSDPPDNRAARAKKSSI
jgi:hypothetical protein